MSLTEDRVKQEQHHMYQNLLEQIPRETDSYVTSIKANVRRVAEDGNMRLVKILEDRKSDWDKKEKMIRCQYC